MNAGALTDKPTASAAQWPLTLCRNCCEIKRLNTAPVTGASDEVGTGHCPACGCDRLVAHPELETLSIAHVDCDAFYASVEKRDRPELRAKPVIVGHPGGRGVVTTACYIARRYGIRSAMPMFQALDRCPDAVVIAPDMGKYKTVSTQIRDIMHAATSVIEPVSLDEAYLDLSDDFRTEAPPAAEALSVIAARVEREVGITVSIGLSCNKFLAKLASDMDKPRGFSIIGGSQAKALLAPLSVRKILGIGAATAERLEASGIVTIGDLQAMSQAQIVAVLGRFGRRVAQYAHGNDDRMVTPYRPVKSVSAETTFRQDTAQREDLLSIAEPLCERVAVQLNRKRLAGGTLVLKLKTSDFKLLTRNRRLTYPTQRADVLLTHAAPLIAREANGRAFRLLGIGVSDLCPQSQADPPDLFGP